MERIAINKTIFTKKTRDYSFVILFLLIFSIFIFFAVRPSLTTAFSLTKEESDLRKIDNLYESRIRDITYIQSKVEENRENFFLLDMALSEYPEVNKIVEDIKISADSNSVIIKKANIADISLSKNKKSLQKVKMIVEGKSDFEGISSFIRDIYNQRRLKTIEKMTISRDNESSISSELRVVLTIEGYYL